MAKRRQQDGRFRIIAGQWRGRRLSFPALAGVRPTPDRVRETLFNWLAPVIQGARFLDLYAGSGALGLEALSRGAARVVFVDRDAAVLQRVREHVELLGATGAAFVQADAVRYLASTDERFDVIALDPPFDTEPWEHLFAQISQRELLCPGGRVYFEMAGGRSVPPLPPPLTLERAKRAGRVGYYLAARQPVEHS